MCSCCKQEMAAAWTRESELSCMMAQPTRQDERMVETVAPFPNNQIELMKKNGLKEPYFTTRPPAFVPANR